MIAQWPNWSLWLFGIMSVVGWIAGPDGTIGRWSGWAATLFLVVWAGDEVLRGVNPWRRCLGAAVLIGLGLRLLAG